MVNAYIQTCNYVLVALCLASYTEILWARHTSFYKRLLKPTEHSLPFVYLRPDHGPREVQ